MDRKIRPILNLTEKVLQLAGLNPEKETLGLRIRSVLAEISITGIFVLQFLGLVLNWSGVESLDQVEYFPSVFIAIFKARFLVSNRQVILKLIKDADNFWPINKFGKTIAKRITALHDFVHKFVKIFLFNVAIAISVLLLQTFLGHHQLTFEIYRVCDYDVKPCYELLCLWQILYLTIQMFPASIGFELLFLCFMFYAYAAAEMLKYGLRNLDGKIKAAAPYRELEKLVEDIVQQHNLVLKYISSLNELYSNILLIQFATAYGGLVICLFKSTSKGTPPSIEYASLYGLIYIILLSQLTIYSFGGHHIFDQALGIADEAYFVDWSHHPQLRKSLTFIILRAQKSEKMTIGYMADLNIVTFASVVKTSWSIYMLLK